MTLIELTEEIQAISSDKNVQYIAEILKNWTNNTESIGDLVDGIERYLGNTWIENEEDFYKVYNLWTNFRENKISFIDNMTMNERLHTFGLLNRFHTCTRQEEKDIIYRKVNANL